jgi:uncharacterized membrane protein YhfC
VDYRVVISFGIAILIDVGFPLAATIWFKRRYGTSWRVWLGGALIFAVFQILSRIPLMLYLNTLVGPEIAESTVLTVGWIAVAALTAGLVEEIGRWVGYRFLFPRFGAERDWPNGVMFGLGHGGIESIVLVGALALTSLLGYMVVSPLDAEQMSAMFPGEQLEAMLAVQEEYRSMPVWQPILGGLERMLTLPIQVCFSVLVLQCFIRNDRRWLLIAVVAHALVDFVVPLVAQSDNLIVVEAVVAAFAVVAVWGVVRLQGEEPKAPPVQEVEQA